MIGATDVFVSYKAEDRARLRPLVAALEAEGFTVWWDTHIGGGAHWREDIQEHLDAAKCVIVVWSKRSVGIEGDFVRDEANRARKRGAYMPSSPRSRGTAARVRRSPGHFAQRMERGP